MEIDLGIGFAFGELTKGKSKKSSIMHTHYVLNDIGMDKKSVVIPDVYLVISVNSIKGGIIYDNPCILNPGDNVHSFITKPSMPNYSRIKFFPDEVLRDRLKNCRIYKDKAPLPMIHKIQDGIEKSGDVIVHALKHYKLLKKHYPHLLKREK